MLYGLADGVATITLNRPESATRSTAPCARTIVAATSAAAADGDVRLVLVRGTGPGFCAGADLKERKGMTDDDVRKRRLRVFAAYDAIEALPMPCIAVVHGPAIGSGCEIAAACDFIVATPAATFPTPEALWGTVGATQRLPRVLGKRLAKDLMFTGRSCPPTKPAPRAGHGLVEAGALDAVLEDIAATIVKASARHCGWPSAASIRAASATRAGRWPSELLAIEENLAQDSQGRYVAHPHGRLQRRDIARLDMNWTPKTLYQFVAERAHTRGEAEALVTATARLNYRDQRAAVRRAAKAMSARGAAWRFRRHSDRQRRNLGHAVLCCRDDRRRRVPVNTRFKSAELAFCLPQADVKALFTADRFLNIDFLHSGAAEPDRSCASRRAHCRCCMRVSWSEARYRGGAPLRCLPRARRRYHG